MAKGKVINTPKDVRRIAREVISSIFREDKKDGSNLEANIAHVVENAAKINQLLQTILRSFEVEWSESRFAEIERRLDEIDKERGKK